MRIHKKGAQLVPDNPSEGGTNLLTLVDDNGSIRDALAAWLLALTRGKDV